jgi:hypothetical protein
VHADDVLHSLECDVFRELGATPIKDIAPTHVLPCCEKLKTVPRLRPRDASGHACQQCLCTLLHRVEQRPIRRPSCRRR